MELSLLVDEGEYFSVDVTTVGGGNVKVVEGFVEIGSLDVSTGN